MDLVTKFENELVAVNKLELFKMFKVFKSDSKSFQEVTT